MSWVYEYYWGTSSSAPAEKNNNDTASAAVNNNKEENKADQVSNDSDLLIPEEASGEDRGRDISID